MCCFHFMIDPMKSEDLQAENTVNFLSILTMKKNFMTQNCLGHRYL